jgi:hypothetical protein
MHTILYILMKTWRSKIVLYMHSYNSKTDVGTNMQLILILRIPVSVCCFWQLNVNTSQRKPKGLSRMFNPETLATFGTQDRGRRKGKCVIFVNNS